MVAGRAPDGGLDDLEDLDGLDDLDEPWSRPEPGPTGGGRRRRTTVALLVCGALALVGVLAGASTLLRSPQERLEARVAGALDDAGVQLAAPVSLSSGDEESRLWTGRVEVLDGDGGTTGVRLALRVDPAAEPAGADGADEPEDGGAAAAAVSVEALFPLVDCDTRYPLTYPGDSDTSFRTTRGDLAECSSDDDGDEVLVTIAWVDDGNRADGVADPPGSAPVDRQTWLTDGRGGLVWMHNADDDGDGGRARGERGLTGEQQRAVASVEGLLDPL